MGRRKYQFKDRAEAEEAYKKAERKALELQWFAIAGCGGCGGSDIDVYVSPEVKARLKAEEAVFSKRLAERVASKV